MKTMRITIVAEYEVKDDPASLEEAYGTTDLDACARFDQEQNSPWELLDLADRIVSAEVKIVPDSSSEED
ncbi:hypothetical protein [Nonomuraea typhae]|uniref:Uncharacterized protein n=1 Tax=Nonomuraea typhae TaxID=2603600 RepID=A0ABW7YMF7_9ACTN